MLSALCHGIYRNDYINSLSVLHTARKGVATLRYAVVGHGTTLGRSSTSGRALSQHCDRRWLSSPRQCLVDRRSLQRCWSSYRALSPSGDAALPFRGHAGHAFGSYGCQFTCADLHDHRRRMFTVPSPTPCIITAFGDQKCVAFDGPLTSKSANSKILSICVNKLTYSSLTRRGSAMVTSSRAG